MSGYPLPSGKFSHHWALSAIGVGNGDAVMCGKEVQQGAQDTALWGSHTEDEGWRGVSASSKHLRPADQEVQGRVT